MKKKFYIGDRVRLVCDHPDDGSLLSGATGVVRDILDEKTHLLPYGVEWDEDVVCGHNLRKTITSKRGWYVKASQIEFEIEEIDYDMMPASDGELSLLLCS